MQRATREISTIAILLSLSVLLPGCGGSSGQDAPAPAPTPPPLGELEQALQRAQSAIKADTCFTKAQTADCNWREQAYSTQAFAMERSTGEAILIVDQFPKLPLRAYRFRHRIKAYYQVGPSGVVPASGSWRLPAALAGALDQFAGPGHSATQALGALSPVIAAQYPGLDLESVGHGSYVFSLLADTNPHQPLVLVNGIDLADVAHAAYCDRTGDATIQAELLDAARKVAENLRALIREHNVRFINYSAGHSLPVLAEGWNRQCGSAPPPADVLRTKLAAYAPIYDTLFGTPGVVAAHAAAEIGQPEDYPYDISGSNWPNRLRTGYFTALDSGLDAEGRGNYGNLGAWPGSGSADAWFNTGVLPSRPFDYNRTPLLQIDAYGTGLIPITAPHTSWVAPLALSRLINLRHAQFGDRPFDDALVPQLLAAAIPQRCPDLPAGRCRYQDPLLHGQVEAVRLEYRPQRLGVNQ